MPKITIVLADDHALVRAGIRSLLESLQDVKVIGEAGDGHEALHLVESLRPHVLFLDIGMKGLNGLEVAARTTKDYPEVRVIVLSMHATEEYVLRALQAGVHGYLLKDSVPTELEIALRAVARGETYLSPGVSSRVIGGYLNRLEDVSKSRTDSNTLLELTSRQREVLQLVAEGLTTKQIAQKLDISAKTVETHRTEIMNRLRIHDIPGLVRFAIRTGLITPEN